MAVLTQENWGRGLRGTVTRKMNSFRLKPPPQDTDFETFTEGDFNSLIDKVGLLKQLVLAGITYSSCCSIILILKVRGE